MAEILGLVGPAVLAILCVVAAARVHRRSGEEHTPAGAVNADAAPVPGDRPTGTEAWEDWQCGDLARALRAARRRRRRRGGIVPKRDDNARPGRDPRRRASTASGAAMAVSWWGTRRATSR